jgi:hypothetical protein
MNVKLLRRIQKHILAEPRRLEMSMWVRKGKPEIDSYQSDSGYVTYPQCGTAACIGGWALIISKKTVNNNGLNTGNRAAQLLGIPAMNGTDAEILSPSDKLFHVSDWPAKYEQAYHHAKSARGRARVAVRRIDHFIKTQGAE